MKNCKHDFMGLARWDSDVQNVFFRPGNFCRGFRIKKRRLPFSSRNVDVDVKNVGPTFAISNAQTRLDEQRIEFATFWNSDLTRFARVLIRVLEWNKVRNCINILGNLFNFKELLMGDVNIYAKWKTDPRKDLLITISHIKGLLCTEWQITYE